MCSYKYRGIGILAMDIIDKNFKIDMENLADFLKIEFDKKFLRNITTIDLEKLLRSKFGTSTITRWLDLKNSTSPETAEKMFMLAGILDLDPFLLYRVNYIRWSQFLYDLDGNISIGSVISFGKIHSNLTFLDHYFSPVTDFPMDSILNYWNEKRADRKNWVCFFFQSDLKEKYTEKEQLILIIPSKFTERQVIHFAYKKPKLLTDLEFWQEYKLVFIRPVKDLLYFLETTTEWNTKDKRFQDKAKKDMLVVLVLNIVGGVKFDFIEKNQPFLIKTKFKDPKTEFKVASLHDFELKLIKRKTQSYKEIFEVPC